MERIKNHTRSSLRAARERTARIRQHPIGLPVLLFVVLVIVSGIALLIGLRRHDAHLSVQPGQNHIAVITVDGNKQTVPTNANTVGELLTKLHLTLQKGDRVEPALTEPITSDQFRINIYRATPVVITDSGLRTMTVSAAATPRGLVTAANIKLYPEDLVTAQPTDNFITQGVATYVKVDRSIPISLSMYGSTSVTVRTRGKTVGNFVQQAGIRLTKLDTLKPAAATPITPNMQIQVIRDGIHTITVTEDIPPPQNTIIDASLSFGVTVVRQPGQPGKMQNTYKISVEHGNEVSRVLLQSVVVLPPVPAVIARGSAVYVTPDKSAVMAAAGISGADFGAVDYIVSHESGWCPTKLQGTHVCPASPPSSIPSGLGYGLVQATPGTKMATAGADWASNPVTQLRWATGYANGRYGGWQGAYQHWLTYHNW